MANAQSKPSREQAENFHVLPKRDTFKNEGLKPASAPTGTAYAERDPEDGSITGAAAGNDLTPSANNSRFDRSQVS